MPLPLIFLAAAPVATAAVSTTTIIAAATASASFISAGFAGIWYFIFKKKKSKLTHEDHDSLTAQAKITQERIDELTNATSLVGVEIKRVATAVMNTAFAATTTSENYLKSVERILLSIQKLQETTHDIEQSSQNLVEALPLLQKISENVAGNLVNTVKKSQQLNQQLVEKKIEIARTTEDIRTLSKYIDEQANTINQLKDTLVTLMADNNDLKNTIQQQHIKYNQLEAAAQHADRNHRLFREFVLTEQNNRLTEPTNGAPTLK